jgi:DNA (cytosine-5)-methyltransferase 1
MNTLAARLTHPADSPCRSAARRPSVLSLFSGAGGLDLGFKRAGFDIALAMDSAPAAVATINANSRSRVAIIADLSTVSAIEIVARLGHHPSGALPRGIIGGPPCQGFSRGNARKDPKDPRNNLPFAYADLIGDLDSRIGIDFFVFENVIGILEQGLLFERLKRAFESAGFQLSVAEIDAEDFGVPQRRRRLFVVGLNKCRLGVREFRFPRGRSASQTVRDTITGLPTPAFYSRKLKPKDIPHHPNHWTMVPKSSRFKEGRFNRWRSFRQLDWDSPSPTVAYGNREIHVHPDGKRRLSVFEAMLLQGFPKSYVLHGNFSEQVTQVSNAVPPPLAFALARSLRRALVEGP